MNDKNQSDTCIVCRSKKLYYCFSIDRYRLEKCSRCGLMRLNPQPNNFELCKIYDKNYFLLSDQKNNNGSLSLLKSKTANHYLDLLEKYIHAPLRGKLLEVGCGYGDLLAQAEARGLEVTGLEYSKYSCSVARTKIKNENQIICGDIDAVFERNTQFDYIIFADVLEHVRDPRDFLYKIHRLLKPNGVIAVAVPSLDSWSAKFMKNKWIEFKPEHLWYFSKQTLNRCLYGNGFGELSTYSARKTLSIEYILEHFNRYPIQPFTSILRTIVKFLPKFILQKPINVVASGLITFARREQINEIKILSVLIPVYNERKTVQGVIERVLAKKIPNLEINLLIVESGSTDGTREILSQYQNHPRIKLIFQETPRGKGYAIREGFRHVCGDYILIQDADDEYDVEDYNVLIDPLIEGSAAFVLGARHGGKVWKLRQFNDQKILGLFLNFGHWFFRTLLNFSFGLKLKDPFTMYKVFRSDCIKGMEFKCNRFDFDYELVIKLAERGYKPIEIPVNYQSRSFKDGKKIKMFRDPLTWLRVIIKLKSECLVHRIVNICRTVHI